MTARAVSHAERLRRRHERAVAARAVPPHGGGTGPSEAVRGGWTDAAGAPPSPSKMAVPPRAEGQGPGDDDEQAVSNPFAGFMGCAP